MMDKNRKTLSISGDTVQSVSIRQKVTLGDWMTVSVDTEGIVICPPEGIKFGDCSTLPETFSRGTGVLDSNDRLIYEGDIIRYADLCDYQCYEEAKEHPELYDGTDPEEYVEYGVVDWFGDEDYPAFDFAPHDFECNGFSYLKNSDYVVEVVGNKWDDPELAEKVMRRGKVVG